MYVSKSSERRNESILHMKWDNSTQWQRQMNKICIPYSLKIKQGVVINKSTKEIKNCINKISSLKEAKKKGNKDEIC